MRTRSSAPQLIAVLAVCIGLIACETPIRVTTDSDPDADFAAYRSYAWISPDPLIPQVEGRTHGPPVSPIDDQRIRDAVDSELALRGWKQMSTTEDADLIVSYGIASEERTEVYETPDSGIYTYRGYRYGGWYRGSTVRTQQVIEGTLTLQFFERDSKQAVWVGWASKRLSKSGTPDREKTIRMAIEKILKEFPSRGATAES